MGKLCASMMKNSQNLRQVCKKVEKTPDLTRESKLETEVYKMGRKILRKSKFETSPNIKSNLDGNVSKK